MSKLLGIMVTLETSSAAWSGTDDHLYVGVQGTGGGREFPLDVAGFNDFEEGTEVIYKLGTVWAAGGAGEKGGSLTPSESSPGGWNDPARGTIDLEKVDYVYLRKGGTRSGSADDLYELAEVSVTLYGPTSESRIFSRTEAIRLANEHGLQVWLPEL